MRVAVFFAVASILVSSISLEAWAEEPSAADLIFRIDSLESQVAQQQAELNSFRAAVGQVPTGRSNEGRPGSVYGGYELTVLQPYFSDAGSGPGFDESVGLGHRFTFGLEKSCGVGVRARYWTYNHSLDGHDLYAGERLHIDMDSLDVDLTFRERFRRWDLLMSGGVRYGRNSYGSYAIFGPGEARFEGAGPTVAFEADRKIVCGGLRLIGNVRGSMLFGDVDYFEAPVEDELMTVLENQLGIGWSRCVWGTTLDVRAVWESQFWLNNFFADTLFGMGTNIGFTGPTVAFELRR